MMPRRFAIWVPGDPAPGGSKSVFHLRDRAGNLVLKNISTAKGIRQIPISRVTDAGIGNKRWRRNVAVCVKAARVPILRGPVAWCFHFVFKRPKNHFGTGRNENILRSDAPPHHMQAPDLLKLCRSTEDALNGIAWLDDCQVLMHYGPTKRWGAESGCIIEIWEIDELPPLPDDVMPSREPKENLFTGVLQ